MKIAPLLLPLLLFPLIACQQAYYQTMEQFGYHKREIMVDRVGAARDSQTEAKEQFKDALEKFSALVDYDGGNLENLDAFLDQNTAGDGNEAAVGCRRQRVLEGWALGEAVAEQSSLSWAQSADNAVGDLDDDEDDLFTLLASDQDRLV